MTKIFDSTTSAKSFLKSGSVLTVGNYDGVHLAHRKILKKLISLAKAQRLKSALLTFQPHPVKILAPELAPKMIMTLEQKIEALSSLGLDTIVVQKFDHKFAKHSAEEFFKKFLKTDLQVKFILVGYDFTFGAKRSGTIETLEALGREAGVRVEIMPAQMERETLVSSTLIRKLIREGQVDLAKKYLTRFYSLDGTVIQGHKRGTALGIHTANLITENELIPEDGVYATFVEFQGRTYKSATNIGLNPTFNNTERSIESHIFDFDRDLYQKKIRLFFVKRIREEIKFVSPEALVMQIKNDIEKAKKILN